LDVNTRKVKELVSLGIMIYGTDFTSEFSVMTQVPKNDVKNVTVDGYAIMKSLYPAAAVATAGVSDMIYIRTWFARKSDTLQIFAVPDHVADI
jgi:hypothetical protein